MKDKFNKLFDKITGFLKLDSDGKDNLKKTLLFWTGWFAIFMLLTVLDISLMEFHISRMRLGAYYHILKNAILYGFLFSSFTLFLGRKSRFFYYPLLTYILLVEISELFMRLNFNMVLDGNLQIILLASSWQEIKDFIGMYTGWFILGPILLVVFLYFAFKYLNYYSNVRVTRISIIFGCICLICFYFDNPVGIKTDIGTPMTKVSYFLIPYGSYKSYDIHKTLWRQLKENVQIPNGLKAKWHDSNDAPIGVLVLGESASRDYWGLYGYSRNTTPAMSAIKDELIIFRNYVAPWMYTGQSLKYTLTQLELNQDKPAGCTIADVYRNIGYRVVFLGAQTRWRSWDTVESTLFSSANRNVYLDELLPNSQRDERFFYYDDALIPYFLEELDKNKDDGTPLLIILHFRGSHCYPKDKCPLYWKPFDGLIDDETKGLNAAALEFRNSYDNTIAFTDVQLEKIVKALRQLKRPSFMLYFSDHGESPRAKSWRTITDIDVWNVPMILWTSNQYQTMFSKTCVDAKKNVDLPLQGDRLFWGIVSLGQITCESFPEEDNCFGEKYKPRLPRMILGGKTPYPPDLGDLNSTGNK